MSGERVWSPKIQIDGRSEEGKPQGSVEFESYRGET